MADGAGYRDLEEFLDPQLRLPWRGKTYTIPPPDYQLGLRMQRLILAGLAALRAAPADVEDDAEPDVELLGDDDERELYPRLLGPVLEQLVADGASWPVIARFGLTAFVHYTAGEEAGQAAWEGKEPPSLNRAQRRAKEKASPKGSSGTGRKSRPPGSTGSTKSTKRSTAPQRR